MGDILTGAASAVQGAVGATGARGQAPPPPQSYVVPIEDASSLLPNAPQAPVDQGGVPQQMAQGALPPAMATILGQPTMEQPDEQPEPVDNRYTSIDDPEALEGPPVDGEDIEVVGDTWQPKKLSPVAKFLDFFLKGNLSHNNRKRNERSAMEGFQRDPDRAISRMRRVDPDKAWDMYDDQSRIRANKALEMTRARADIERGGNNLGNMLGAIQASSTPAKVYGERLPHLRRYAKHMGYPEDMLPDTYDETGVEMLRSASIPTFQQERLKQFDTALEAQNTRHTQSIEAANQRHTQTVEGTNQRHANAITESRRRFEIQQGGKAGKPQSYAGKLVLDKATNKPVGQVSKSGMYATVTGESGEVMIFEHSNGKFGRRRTDLEEALKEQD